MKSERKQMGKLKDQVVFPVADTLSAMPESYTGFISSLKIQIQRERQKAIFSANKAMILMYWNIGKAVSERMEAEKWGSKVIDRMSYDLKETFSDMEGFSPRNLKYMRKFFEAWTDFEIVQRTVALIPWRSNITLLDKLKEPELRLWYAHKTIELGLGKDMLAIQIESKLHIRQGNTVNNFSVSLPRPESDLVQQTFKDPYIFDFVGNATDMRERELEQKLIDHIQKFLLELGQGFAFVGRQVHLELGGNDYYIDLLLYHIKLKRYVVVELKKGQFEPEHISKLNFYLNVVNDVLCQSDDNKTIGLLLVKGKDKTVVEYALSGFNNPIGVSNWENQLMSAMPENLKSSLPTIKEIEEQLSKEDNEE